MKKKNIAAWFCFGFAIIFAIAGVTLFFLMDTIVRNNIEANIPLKKGSTSYNNWLNPPVPVYMQFWIFHVKNGYSVQKHGGRPVLEQKGPYTYQEQRVKKDIKFHPNGTISYRQDKSYIFVPEMSAGSEDDVVCNINLLLVGVTQMLKYKNWLIKTLVEAGIETFDGDQVFVNHTVRDWLWGYEDPMIKAIKSILDKLPINITLPFPDKVGLYYGKNGTDDGLYTVYSGTKDVSKFSVIDLWNGNSKLSYWNSEIANDINGTDGTTFPPFITKNDKLFIFSTDLCRSIDIVYQKPVTIKGIDLMRFVAPDILFANSTINPDNAGFCTPNCLDSGVLNVSVCQNGLPAIMSQPHFFQAAQKYKDAVVGLNPSAQLSQTHIDVDPHTGVVLNAAKKIQVNIAVSPVSGFDSLNKIDLFLPLVWVNESATVDDKSANTFKKDVLDLILTATILKIVVLVVSLVFLLITIIVLIYILKCTNVEEPERSKLINEETEGQASPE